MMYSTGEISPDAMQKPAGNKGKHTEGQCMETLGSARECDWVVALQILTPVRFVKPNLDRTLPVDLTGNAAHRLYEGGTERLHEKSGAPWSI